MKWPRRHSYRETVRGTWAGRKVHVMQCSACGNRICLYDWQVRSMPWSMAVCPVGTRLSWFEVLFGPLLGLSIDCYEAGVPEGS